MAKAGGEHVGPRHPRWCPTVEEEQGFGFLLAMSWGACGGGCGVGWGSRGPRKS